MSWIFVMLKFCVWLVFGGRGFLSCCLMVIFRWYVGRC